MKLREKVHEYLLSIGYKQEDLSAFDSSSVYIAQEIAIYAHRGQKRVNGEDYVVHPFGVLQNYRDFVGIVDGDYFCLDEDLLVGECGIPYRGVQEVCLLHDVLEDTSVTIDEIEEFYDQMGLGSFFKLYVKNPLLLITHDDEDDYAVYIGRLMADVTASIVKFMDFANNMNPITLKEFGEKEVKRIYEYATYASILNTRWNFLEKIEKYRRLRAEKKKNNN